MELTERIRRAAEAAETPPVIQMNGIVKRYYEGKENELEILHGIDLTVRQGDFVAIVGESGSGKSTLMNIIGALDKPTAGTYLLDGTNVQAMTDSQLSVIRNKKIGFVFQNFNLIGRTSALKNVELPMLYAHVPPRQRTQRARELLAAVGMAERAEHQPNELSGGQKQRVAIARALSTEPRVLLCDEATSALDPETTDSILGLIRDINKRLGITAVVITHEMDVIEKICSKVAIISKGVIAETGTVNEVFFHPRSEIARRLVVPEALHPDKMKLPKLYRLIFDGQSSFDPVVSNMVLACGKPVNIMYASTQDIGGTAFGQMVLQLPEDEESIARIQAYVKEHGLYLEEFTHA